jgi:hypothetical protein
LQHSPPRSAARSADQWKDFYTVPEACRRRLPCSPRCRVAQNAGRGSNTKGSEHHHQRQPHRRARGLRPAAHGGGCDHRLRAEPGGYEWRSDDINSQSIFAGDGIVSPLIKTEWERFKFGGQPGTQQRRTSSR